jgi:hypothetical protein
MCTHRSSASNSSKDSHHVKGDSVAHSSSSSSSGSSNSALLELFTEQCSKWLAVFTLPELRDVLRALCEVHYRSDALVKEIEQQVSCSSVATAYSYCSEHIRPLESNSSAVDRFQHTASSVYILLIFKALSCLDV